MRSTTMLALAALCVAGCKDPGYSMGISCFMDTPCSSGPGNYGPIITTSMIGFPTSRVDTVGPRTIGGYYYGRLQVGDSVTLYLVKHEAAADPCASPDTLRTVAWSAYNPAVLEARADSNGRGVVRAVATGESVAIATAPVIGATTNLWTCNGSRIGHYVGMVKVDPKSP